MAAEGRPEIEMLLILEERARDGRPWIGAVPLSCLLRRRANWNGGASTLISKKGGRALYQKRGEGVGTEWSLSEAGRRRAASTRRRVGSQVLVGISRLLQETGGGSR